MLKRAKEGLTRLIEELFSGNDVYVKQSEMKAEEELILDKEYLNRVEARVKAIMAVRAQVDSKYLNPRRETLKIVTDEEYTGSFNFLTF